LVGATKGQGVTEGRAKILGAVRTALGRGPLTEAATSALVDRLNHPRANLVPARGCVEAARQVELFIAEAERVNATTARIRGWEDVPSAAAQYLRGANLPMRIRSAADAEASAVPWRQEPTLAVETGPVSGSDAIGFVAAFAGIAETGTVMVWSSPERPTLLNFLPATHIVVLSADRIVGTYEEAWNRLRAILGNGMMPRTVNWITGPSRTADIEQTLLLGAHGPQRLHILIIDGRAH
jgi:L-lactate dehydrogenase complex protein LldG